VDGDPGQPHSDATAQRLPEAVSASSESGSADAEPPLWKEPPARTEPPVWSEPAMGGASPEVQAELPLPGLPPPAAMGAPRPYPPYSTMSSSSHPEMQHPRPEGIRLAQVKEEVTAWVKTLVSAAVYAVLIVTFGFQVARVEGQSMAPTLEDQDRLIVNKF